MRPYYHDDRSGVTIYHGDYLQVIQTIKMPWVAAVVTDPPYGIDYQSGHEGVLARSIAGDKDTALRDQMLFDLAGVPTLCFGTWRVPRPEGTRMVLVWDTKGALGMGALDLPWKPAHQEIYVIGSGFKGHRGPDVLSFAPVQSMAKNGRVHPHEKPVALMLELLRKCPSGQVIDPFMGSGTTLVAAKQLGRPVIGIELEERYCEIAAKRLQQECLLSFESEFSEPYDGASGDREDALREDAEARREASDLWHERNDRS